MTTKNSKPVSNMWKTKNNKTPYVMALLAILLLAVLLLTLPNKATKTPKSTKHVVSITITKAGFNPSTLIVTKGTTITWTNTDDANHQPYANPYPSGKSLPGLQSKSLSPNQTYSYLADQPGSYGYHDQLNPTTNGTIEVKD